MNSPPSSTAATSPSGKADFNLAFGQAKYIGALWMAYLARQHPDRRFITVSPGATTGTKASTGLALPLRVAAKYVMPALGIPTDSTWAQSDWSTVSPTRPCLAVYSTPARPTRLKGPLVNQADIFPDLANPSFQDHANEAIHRYMT